MGLMWISFCAKYLLNSYFVENSGHYQLDKGAAFCGALSGRSLSGDMLFTEFISELDDLLRCENPTVTTGALSNAHGDWYEWLLALAGWNYHLENQTRFVPLLLPNVSQFDVSALYVSDLKEFIDDLRRKVELASSVNFTTSNPDFVLIDTAEIGLPSVHCGQLFEITPESLGVLNSAYRDLIGKCDFGAIGGYISVKTSLRPDRRLQLAHEGSLMKALYVHMQTRQWIFNPPGLKYYAVSTEVGPADEKALKTVATHSITSVHSAPEAAVDGVFKVNSLAEASAFFGQIL
jgi:hypothetical protein